MTNQRSLDLRKQMLEDRIDRIANDLEISKDSAFMRLAYSFLFNTNYDDSNFFEDVVDGNDDKQIDIIRIDENGDSATIHILQIKNTDKYSSNVVVQMRDALSWCFERPEDQYKNLIHNKDLVLKISNIREVSVKYGLRNLSVYVHYIAKGVTGQLSPNFKKEVLLTRNEYANSQEFREFDFKVWGVDELIDRLYETEEQRRRIDIDLQVFKVWDYPTYLRYTASMIEAIICTVDGNEIARIVNDHEKQLFDENVRTYLGAKKQSVNDDISNTCSSDEEAEYFWFFNNGITATCDRFDIVGSVEPAILKISNIQIVNGCQTSMSLREAANNKKLSPKTRVLLKVFATQDKRFVDKITLTTNRQNAVSSRDLSSNDQLQRHLQDLFGARGYFYERKPRMFKDADIDRKKVIANDKVGQAYLAVVMHAPATAMAHSNRIWRGDLYEKIFSSSVEDLLGSYLIYYYCLNKSKEVSKNTEGTGKAISKYGNFHLASLIGALKVGPHWKQPSTQQQLANFIKEIEVDPSSLDEYYFQAKGMLEKIIETLYEQDTSKLINVFKSEKINVEIANLIKSMSKASKP